MYEARAVGEVEPVADFVYDANRVLNRETSLAAQAIAQRAAGDVDGDVIQHPIGFTGVDERNEMRMRQSRRDRDLAEEPVGTERRQELGAEHLDRDLSSVLSLLGEVHGRHTAMPKLPLDDVPIDERRTRQQCRRRRGVMRERGRFGHDVQSTLSDARLTFKPLL